VEFVDKPNTPFDRSKNKVIFTLHFLPKIDMSSFKTNPYVQVHAAVFLFGMTAILGGLIQLEALVLVWWRVLLASISLLFLTDWGRQSLALGRDKIFAFAGIGVLMALHWLCFYGTIKIANASIALITMALVALFTAFLEPWFLGKKINKLELYTGLAVIPGMILVAGNIDSSMVVGFGVGILSALLAAIFSTLNKKIMDQDSPVFAITLVEMIAAWIVLGLMLAIWSISGQPIKSFFPPTSTDWMWMIVLAVLCTTIAQALFLSALKSLSTFTSNLVNNLEPVYGILLAAVILKEYEQLNTMFYIGSAIILATVVVFPMLNKKPS
jgi:drug/metabolite transporter (DMT)-like permease